MNGQREKAFLKKPVLTNHTAIIVKKKKKLVKWLAVIMQNQFKRQNLKSVKLATKKKKKPQHKTPKNYSQLLQKVSPINP